MFRLLLAISILFPFSTLAQNQKESAKPGAKPRMEQSAVRQTALSTLDAVVDELPTLVDLALRIELTETAVKLLAKKRPQHCRRALDSLFAKAIEAAAERAKDKARHDYHKGIGRVIQIAAFLDRDLAQSYIRKYANEEELDNRSSNKSERDVSVAEAYLKIATELIETDPRLSVLVATESLRAGTGPETLVFLAKLSKRDNRAAHTFFSAALRSVQFRKGTDVNELLLLYAFLFSPSRVPNVSPQGIGVFSIPGYLGAAGTSVIDPNLARHYLEVSAKLLLAPNRYLPENINQLVNGPQGDFYFLNVIEPSFSEYLAHAGTPIAQQRNLLANYLEGESRNHAFAVVDRWTRMPKDATVVGSGNRTSVEYLASQAEQTSNLRVRDQLFFRAALMAVKSGEHEKALDLVGRLAPEPGNKAEQLINFNLALEMRRLGKFEEAEHLTRRDDVLVRRAYVLTLIADALVKGNLKDEVRARRLLEDVKELAQKLNDPNERLAVKVGAAGVYAQFDQTQAFELLAEVIRSINKSETFDDNLSVSNSLFIGGFLFDFALYENDFSYYDLLNKLATRDFYLSLQNTRDIRNPAVRIHSIVEICKAALTLAPNPSATSQTPN